LASRKATSLSQRCCFRAAFLMANAAGEEI
jgi:hypothetical protein